MDLSKRHREEGSFVLEPSNTTDIDEVGFSLRLEGVNIRDCVVIQSPEGPSFVMVGQVPSNQTFLEQVVRGQGSVLDIDGSRVAYEKGGTVASNPMLRRERGCKTKAGKGTGFWGQANSQPEIGNEAGRFPTNLILKHGADCYCDGTEKVKGSQLDHDCGKFGQNGIYGSGTRKLRFTGYTSEDGTQEVPNWTCEPTCPVRILDAQSGNRPSTLARLGIRGSVKNPATKSDEAGIYGNFKRDLLSDHGKVYCDEGGASRFFKQVTSEDELDTYLENLVRRG